MKNIIVIFALAAAAVFSLVCLATTADPNEEARAEANKQEAVEYARRQYVMRKKLERISSETKLQVAEASK